MDFTFMLLTVAVYVAKKIGRGNLWVFKCRDWTMKTQLLQMMEWYAWAIHGVEYETFHDGHYLADWAEMETWEKLHHTFGSFNTAASWDALLETMELFRRLAVRTALCWGYDYPAVLDKRISSFVRNIYQESLSRIS